MKALMLAIIFPFTFVSLQKTLPPLRHTYIVPFIPSGFWPRLMSRILTDHTIIQLAKEGCGITNNGARVCVCDLICIRASQPHTQVLISLL